MLHIDWIALCSVTFCGKVCYFIARLMALSYYNCSRYFKLPIQKQEWTVKPTKMIVMRLDI